MTSARRGFERSKRLPLAYLPALPLAALTPALQKVGVLRRSLGVPEVAGDNRPYLFFVRLPQQPPEDFLKAFPVITIRHECSNPLYWLTPAVAAGCFSGEGFLGEAPGTLFFLGLAGVGGTLVGCHSASAQYLPSLMKSLFRPRLV